MVDDQRPIGGKAAQFLQLRAVELCEVAVAGEYDSTAYGLSDEVAIDPRKCEVGEPLEGLPRERRVFRRQHEFPFLGDGARVTGNQYESARQHLKGGDVEQ